MIKNNFIWFQFSVQCSVISSVFWLGSASFFWLRLYKAFILPHFYYCSMVWHFCSKRDSDKLDLLNKRILRFIFEDEILTTNLANRRIQNMILSVLKCLHFGKYAKFLKDIFKLRSSTYSLRGTDILSLPEVCTTTYGLNSYSNVAATSIPDH